MNERANWSALVDTQHQVAASRHGLRASGLQREGSPNLAMHCRRYHFVPDYLSQTPPAILGASECLAASPWCRSFS